MSLKNGTATKAYMYWDVRFWDIRNQCLLHTDSQNRIYVEDLRSVCTEEQRRAEIDLAVVIDSTTRILNVRLSDSSDIVASVSIASNVPDETRQSDPGMHTSTEAKGSDGKNTNIGVDREDNKYQSTTSTPLSDSQNQTNCYLIKLCREGTIVWKVKQMACTSTTCSDCRSGVISKNHYFDFEHFRDERGEAIDDVIAFTSRNLTDGGIVMQTRLPQECSAQFINGNFGEESQQHIPRNGTTMILNDCVLGGPTIVFDTSTGNRVPFPHPLDGTMIFGATSDKIWVLGLHENHMIKSGQHSFYDQATQKMQSFPIWFRKVIRYLESTIGIDMERQLMFRLLHSDIQPSGTVDCLDQLTTLGISNVREFPPPQGWASRLFPTISEQETMLMVTLPPRPKQARPVSATKNVVKDKSKSKAKTEAQGHGAQQQKNPPTARRLLEVETPWERSHFDFLGMSNDFLVHYIHETRTLMVVDFWPPW